MSANPLLAELGYAADARLVIFHADDVGMCHGGNRAYLELVKHGLVKTGSVMIPCPWSQEILEAAAADRALDLGVHLTLNAEWPGYRWGPVSTRDPASGLIDDEGWFWHRPEFLMPHLDVPAALTELRAQLEWARRSTLDFTHIDTHMGAAMHGSLLRHYVELGFEYGVPVLLPRRVDEYVSGLKVALGSAADYLAFTQEVEARGMPLVDTFRITPGYNPGGGEGGRAELYESILSALPEGVTYFSLHPNAPGDIEQITPERAHWRTFEHAYFQSQRLRDFLSGEGIIPIGYREIRDVMRARRSIPA